jgi:ectoine hydroxylase-related dioxygenase (phytanoyl-CoA dioxygenase family)
MAIPRFDRSTTAQTLSAELIATGAVIVEGFLDPATLRSLNGEIEGALAQERADRDFMSPIYQEFFGRKTLHLTALPARSAVFRDRLLCHPLYLGICDDILLPNCANYQLNYSHIFDIGPGAQAQALHRDGLCWSYLPRTFEIEVASIVALSDFTADNGATRVLPGSHRWPYERELRYEDTVPAVMPAGSALLYLGATVHAGGANRTEQRRRGMHVSFCLGWLRTEENNYLAAPLEQARHYSPQVQTLLGYAAHDAAPTGGCLGVYNMLDPLKLIESRRL